MPRQETDYRAEAASDARDMIDNFKDEIADQLIESGEASDDFLNDYTNGDSYHHETHVDKAYSLLEAAQLLDELDEFEETDSGLWEGLSPREAIGAQAAYTYGNAVYSMARDIIEQINDDEDIQELLEKRDQTDAERDSDPDATADDDTALRAALAGIIDAMNTA